MMDLADRQRAKRHRLGNLITPGGKKCPKRKGGKWDPYMTKSSSEGRPLDWNVRLRATKKPSWVIKMKSQNWKIKKKKELKKEKRKEKEEKKHFGARSTKSLGAIASPPCLFIIYSARTARSARDCPDSALYQVPSTHFLSAVWLSLSLSLLPQTHNLPRL